MLNFGSESTDMLWIGDAIEQKLLKEGGYVKVVQITEVSSGKGFLLECLEGTLICYDFAYRNGRVGKTLATMVDDPTLADDTDIQCKAQGKVRNAQLKSSELKGVRWNLGVADDLNVLTRVGKKNPQTAESTKPTDDSSSQQSQSRVPSKVA